MVNVQVWSISYDGEDTLLENKLLKRHSGRKPFSILPYSPGHRRLFIFFLSQEFFCNSWTKLTKLFTLSSASAWITICSMSGYPLNMKLVSYSSLFPLEDFDFVVFMFLNSSLVLMKKVMSSESQHIRILLWFLTFSSLPLLLKISCKPALDSLRDLISQCLTPLRIGISSLSI